MTVLLPNGDSFALDDVQIDDKTTSLGLQDSADEVSPADVDSDDELVVELDDESEEADAVARLFLDRADDNTDGLALKGKASAPAPKTPSAKKPIVIAAKKPVAKAPRPEKKATGTVASKNGNTYQVALASGAKGQKARVSVNEIIDLRDFVLPKMKVQAFSGTMNGKPYRVTNYREDVQGGGVRFYQVFAGNPKQFVVKEWTDAGFFARVDMLQWYSYANGRMLPAKLSRHAVHAKYHDAVVPAGILQTERDAARVFLDQDRGRPFSRGGRESRPPGYDPRRLPPRGEGMPRRRGRIHGLLAPVRSTALVRRVPRQDHE